VELVNWELVAGVVDPVNRWILPLVKLWNVPDVTEMELNQVHVAGVMDLDRLMMVLKTTTKTL